MDLYDENFKIQDMIDSDMRSLRCELDDYMSVLPRSPGGSSALSSLPHVMPMDIIGESALDSDLSEDGMGCWMDSSHIYNVSSDLDSVGGLLVNPQTALPVTVAPIATTTIATSSMTSTPVSGAVNLTLTPQPSVNGETSTTSCGVTVPVRVITTTTTLVTDGDNKTSQVNLTVAVPTPETTPLTASKGTQVQHVLSFRKSLQEIEDNESPKSRSKQNKNAKLSKSISMENSYPKPGYSYSCLIAMALKNSKTGSLPVNEIYDFMTENFPYFKTAPNGWKNSVRHNLSLNKCFEKIEKPTGNGAQRKGYLWALNPEKVEKMEEELQKWGSKDPEAIRKSMANPEKLELIEKGELNNVDVDIKKEASVFSNDQFKKEIKIKAEHNAANNSVNTDFSPLDAPVGMDPALPEFDLQKGIWENLCDDRLQFLNEIPISSSSPKHGGTTSSINLDEDSLRTSPPSDLPKSFVHANYIYSCTRHSSSELSGDDSSTHHSNAEKSAVCDA